MTDNIKKVSVTLAGRTYPVISTIDEEVIIRQINVELNEEITTMQKQYANKLNKQDILAMLLLNYAKKLHEVNQKQDMTAIENRVINIKNILDQAFGKDSKV